MKSKLLRKHLLSIAIFGLVLIIAFGAVINEMVIRIMFRHYENMGRGAARFMSNTINADRISAYLETNEPDLYYSALVDILSLLCEDYDFTYAYVAVPEEEGLRYICASDTSASDNLGKLAAYLPGEREWAQRIMAGDTDAGMIHLKDEAVTKAEGRILTGRMDQYNDFDRAELAIAPFADFSIEKGQLTVRMPACSVAELRIG